MSHLSDELRRQAMATYKAAEALDLAEAIIRRPFTADTEMDEWNLREFLDGVKYEEFPAWANVKLRT